MSDPVLLTGRTHVKVLFGPLIVQLVLIAGHIAALLFLPEHTGFDLFDQWGQLAVHSLIGVLEFTYAIVPFLRWYNSVFTVTTQRVTASWGVLYKDSREIALDRIVSVDTERGILDRIVGCGTLIFHDAATDASQRRENVLTWQSGGGQRAGIRFQDVPHVKRVRALVDDLRYADVGQP